MDTINRYIELNTKGTSSFFSASPQEGNATMQLKEFIVGRQKLCLRLQRDGEKLHAWAQSRSTLEETTGWRLWLEMRFVQERDSFSSSEWLEHELITTPRKQTLPEFNKVRTALISVLDKIRQARLSTLVAQSKHEGSSFSTPPPLFLPEIKEEDIKDVKVKREPSPEPERFHRRMAPSPPPLDTTSSDLADHPHS
ncbi:hypothetical protein P7C70_g659, partial [Phenoliferia sp. Uapishka_3]